jgi:hypothetical protein
MCIYTYHDYCKWDTDKIPPIQSRLSFSFYQQYNPSAMSIIYIYKHIYTIYLYLCMVCHWSPSPGAAPPTPDSAASACPVARGSLSRHAFACCCVVHSQQVRWHVSSFVMESCPSRLAQHHIPRWCHDTPLSISTQDRLSIYVTLFRFDKSRLDASVLPYPPSRQETRQSARLSCVLVTAARKMTMHIWWA